ncbi:MAG: integrase family protein [Proteobacteria bacterium]|nr:integrase family protein [Pseudomonadota bacterium]
MARWENFTAGRVNDFTCQTGKRQSIYWDGKSPGLGLRVTAAGSKAYIFETQINGKTLRLTIGDVRTWKVGKAQDEAARLKVLTDQGIDPRQLKAEQAAKVEAVKVQAKADAEAAKVEETRNTMIVQTAWSAYLAHHERRWGARHMMDHVNLSQAGGELKKRGKGLTVQGVLYPLLQLRMVDINADTLTAWQATEAETRANNARQGFEMFRAFWRWCATHKDYSQIIDVQAVEDKDVRAEVPSRKSKKFDVLQRAYLPAWFEAVQGLSNPVMSAYLQGLLLTGCRREELAELKWADVDFRWGSIWVKDKIAAEGRKIPLTPYLSHLLANLPRRNQWVFSSPTAEDGKIAEPRLPHNRALSVAGLDHVTLHGLRRTFASLAEWVEMPTGIVAQIMGHAPNATAERHYINRPLELLALWHGKYETWILEQAGIQFEPEQARPSLRVVK